MKDSVTEYVITYLDGDEFITEDKEEADRVFHETQLNAKQYFRKEWVRDVDGDWTEGDVEVYNG